MFRMVFAFAAATIVAAPAFAQAPTQTPAEQAPAAEQRTEMKRVCEAVPVERTTGSRLSSTTRVCKMVEVPVEDDSKARNRAGGTEHTH